jgi:hypothetical protein
MGNVKVLGEFICVCGEELVCDWLGGEIYYVKYEWIRVWGDWVVRRKRTLLGIDYKYDWSFSFFDREVWESEELVEGIKEDIYFKRSYGIRYLRDFEFMVWVNLSNEFSSDGGGS